METWFGTEMREPVTTTSCSEASLAAAGAVCALATPNVAANEPPVSASRTAIRSRGFPRLSFCIERLSGYSIRSINTYAMLARTKEQADSGRHMHGASIGALWRARSIGIVASIPWIFAISRHLLVDCHGYSLTFRLPVRNRRPHGAGRLDSGDGGGGRMPRRVARRPGRLASRQHRGPVRGQEGNGSGADGRTACDRFKGRPMPAAESRVPAGTRAPSRGAVERGRSGCAWRQ